MADVLFMRGAAGVLSPPLSPFTTLERTVIGRARTVRLEPVEPPRGSLQDLYAVLDEDLSDEVLVVAGAEEVDAAVWGQILSRAAVRAGAGAALISGAVRDRLDLTREGLPVWARRERTLGAVGVASVAAVDQPVAIGDVTIEPGDTILVDAHGVVALPRERVDELLSGAVELTRAEAALLTELEGATKLTQAYELKRSAVKRLREG